MNIKNTRKNSEDYHKLLEEIKKPPSPLFYKGRLPEPDELCIAIVGTRKASKNSQGIAKDIAYNLADKGITIVSGLAYGIDAAAHKGTLEAGGRTVAVMAHGLNRIYPKEHEALAERITETNGCLVSEYENDKSPEADKFLKRNRIISGFSIATVIVEAPSRSGSLNTARHAIEQNREVFVVPGRADNKNFKGSHKLIRQGARLATTADEILEDLNIKN